ncbi:hypothetical protein PR003_g7439 [Phytophthora rubi]|uniref:Uncharacterized protein n=1 Tax=Phytophthora rubi TaxID=129364 RepID=A0A6A3LEU7_9STRA|nr:hypothetical protein PR002_g13482 [Phytophthora rubi]KAE9039917.1 hypothetical protein PR001_g7304 [Phytophthora rubi]KAE9346413.1 hypothetical protein PR003_g7439 [Phytophthora rubi]
MASPSVAAVSAFASRPVTTSSEAAPSPSLHVLFFTSTKPPQQRPPRRSLLTQQPLEVLHR